MGMLNDFEVKLESASKKLDTLIAKIDSLLGTVPLADPVDLPVVSDPASVADVVSAEVAAEVNKVIEEMSKVNG